MILPWENSLTVLEVLIIVCSSDLPYGTFSTCLSDTPILGSGHVWLYPLDTVPTGIIINSRFYEDKLFVNYLYKQFFKNDRYEPNWT